MHSYSAIRINFQCSKQYKFSKILFKTKPDLTNILLGEELHNKEQEATLQNEQNDKHFYWNNSLT